MTDEAEDPTVDLPPCGRCDGRTAERTVTTLELAGLEPDDLRELADLIERQRAERLERLISAVDMPDGRPRPALGAYRQGRNR